MRLIGDLTETPLAAELARGARIVASVSGGKDSTAMALALRAAGLDFDAVFMDTGWEHPATYAYLRDVLPEAIGREIRWLRAEVEVPERYREEVEAIEAMLGHYSAFVRVGVRKGMFPARTIRWCTQELKIYVIRRWMRAQGSRIISAQGIRAEESAPRAKLPPWEDHDGDAATWRPLLRWSLADVVAIHAEHGIAPNPLYLWGALRVGCWPCIHSAKAEIRLVADMDPGRIAVMRRWEALLQQTARDRIADKGDLVVGRVRRVKRSELAPTAFFQAPSPREVAADGSRSGSCPPIDRVVEWSRTSRGGRQTEIFAPDPGREGCMRWGLCDTAPAEFRGAPRATKEPTP